MFTTARLFKGINTMPNTKPIDKEKRDPVIIINPVITASLSSNNRSSDWLEWDSIKMSGRFIKVPERVQIPENIKEQLIVELYSK
jgi:ribosomal protein S4